LKTSIGLAARFGVALQGGKEKETQGFTKLDNGSEIVGVDKPIAPSEIAPAKQSKKRQI
jgi:hypothetical protein